VGNYAKRDIIRLIAQPRQKRKISLEKSSRVAIAQTSTETRRFAARVTASACCVTSQVFLARFFLISPFPILLPPMPYTLVASVSLRSSNESEPLATSFRANRLPQLSAVESRTSVSISVLTILAILEENLSIRNSRNSILHSEA